MWQANDAEAIRTAMADLAGQGCTPMQRG